MLSGPVKDALFFLIPFAVVGLALALIVWRSNVLERRVMNFAAAEGITYRRRDSPIVVPQLIYEAPRWGTGCSPWDMGKFLYGTRHGLEVFACDFVVGPLRRSASTLSMVAVRAQLHEVSTLDLKRWKLVLLNNWSFLVPRRLDNGNLSTGEIALLWDALTAASVDRGTSAHIPAGVDASSAAVRIEFPGDKK